MEFLRAALADGERPATEVLTEATALGIAERTLRRARKVLGLRHCSEPRSASKVIS